MLCLLFFKREKVIHHTLLLFSVILIKLSNYHQVHSKIVKGHLITSEKWAFLDRFCFLSYFGTFQYEIEYEPSQGTVSLLMYPDIQWRGAYRNPEARTCQQKNDVLIVEKRQLVRLEMNKDDSGCEQVYRPEFTTPIENNGTQNFSNVLFCKNSRSFRSARERWWFISISNCNATQGLNVKYKFKMTNGAPGDYWYEHFSADEFYILPILTGFCFVYFFLLFSALLFAVELKCRQLLHITYKLFLVSLASQNLGIVLFCMHYGRYASNGMGFPKIKLSGRIFEGISDFFFLLLLLLLAKGYTVTRGRLRLASAVKLTVFNCAYLVVYIFLFFFEQYFFDPGLVLYIYESPAGYGILVLRIIGWLMFVYSIFFTVKHYPEKSSFYVPFFALYSFWFVSGPITILISNHVIDKWVREKVSISVEHCCMFIGHVVFLGLTRPSAANKSFPYHVRTTQVGADSSNGNNGTQQRLDRFDSHSYAPSYIDQSGRIVDIFTVTGVTASPINHSLPIDPFHVNGGPHSPPPVFPIPPPPKYSDAFPHETPGQIEEMLKESEYSDEDSAEAEAEGGENEENGNGRINSARASASASTASAVRRSGNTNKRKRESAYAISNNENDTGIGNGINNLQLDSHL